MKREEDRLFCKDNLRKRRYNTCIKERPAIRFDENNLKPQGRTAMGVRGIKLREGDKVVGASTSEETLLFITAKGYGKRTKLEEFRRAGRGEWESRP